MMWISARIDRRSGTEPAVVSMDASQASVDSKSPGGRSVGYPARDDMVAARAERVALISQADERGFRVVSDAVLDNIDDLCAALDLRPGATVAQVLVRGFERWGFQLPTRLVGDFAFVIWDGRKQTVFAARDPFGIRSLVYHRSRSGLNLATDVAQLIPHLPGPVAPDEATVFEYLAWDYQERGRTFFRDIQRVPAGHHLFCTGTTFRIEPYWEPPRKEIRLANAEAYHQEFRELFFKAVTDRLSSSRLTLVHLSGGIDSSSIACVADTLVRQGHSSSVKAVSAEFPGLSCDEGPFINAVRHKLSIPSESWDGTQSKLSDLDDPALNWPCGRTFFSGGTHGDLDIAVRDGASTLLSGSGGDQVGSPEGVLRDLGSSHQWSRLLRTIAFERSGSLREKFGVLVDSLGGLSPRWGRHLYRSLQSVRSGRTSASWSNRPERRWLSPGLRRLASERSRNPSPALSTFLSNIQRRRWMALTGLALGWSIERQQRLASDHGIVVRFPFLDVRLVRFVLAIPFNFWPTGRYPARLHRFALESYLPREIVVGRAKTYFGDAHRHRVRVARDRVRQILTSGEWASAGYVDRTEAQNLLSYCENPEAAPFWALYDIWQIATLEMWLRGLARCRF